MLDDDDYNDYWEVPENLDTTDFDFDWQPDAYEPEFIHQFGTQHQPTGGPRYIAAGATEIKYETFQRAIALPDMGKWEIPAHLDTSKFDFSWHPEVTDKPFIYQFGTQHQRTGGPRYVESGARRMKYIDSQHAVKLVDMSKWIIKTDTDIIDFDFSWHPDDNDDICNYAFGDQDLPPEVNTVLTYKKFDTAHIKYMTERVNAKRKSLDIIFVSNGELGEQPRYDRLCELAGREVKWVKGIDGRENALRHAATISTTQYFILFPGKMWADEHFDFEFKPPLNHEPKHYIFYATNPLNGLEYGHQAAVCYNRELVLETIDYGLDFTMSKLHDIVPVTCGIAQYNSNIIMTWRTAFREVIKLLVDGSEESLERLHVWKTYARGKHAEWSIIGAEDGIEYYNLVSGEHGELMKTFAWSWLEEHFNQLRPGVI